MLRLNNLFEKYIFNKKIDFCECYKINEMTLGDCYKTFVLRKSIQSIFIVPPPPPSIYCKPHYYNCNKILFLHNDLPCNNTCFVIGFASHAGVGI